MASPRLNDSWLINYTRFLSIPTDNIRLGLKLNFILRFVSYSIYAGCIYVMVIIKGFPWLLVTFSVAWLVVTLHSLYLTFTAKNASGHLPSPLRTVDLNKCKIPYIIDYIYNNNIRWTTLSLFSKISFYFSCSIYYIIGSENLFSAWGYDSIHTF